MAEKCAGKVWGSYDWGSCSYTGKTEEGGKWWCSHHLPSRVEAKRTAREAEWQAEWEAREARIAADQAEAAERDRRAALFPQLVAGIADIQEIAESGDHAIVRVSLKARALLKQAEPHD